VLPGEDLETDHLDDVEHWVAVYTELVAGKARILDATLVEMETARHDDTRNELVSDQTLLLAELDRFQRRLRFWHEREIDLRAAGA
jgi:hypothetical protein